MSKLKRDEEDKSEIREYFKLLFLALELEKVDMSQRALSATRS